ncbi:PDZ domain-containing protein [bacterium]|nr:PDZ domain-containing protein [bacterium]
MKAGVFIIEHYRTLTNYFGTALVAWLLSALLAQVVAMFIPTTTAIVSSSAPKKQALTPSIFAQRETVDRFMQICERNIFDSAKRTACTEEVAVNEPQFNPNAAPVKSDINAQLLGTMVLTGSSSYASITVNGESKSKTYKVGQTFAGEATIYEIQRNKVFFNRKGKREYIEVAKLPQFSRGPARSSRPSSPSSAGIKRDGDKITLSRSKVESTLNDLNKILQDARMVPSYNNGKVTGFKIFAIRRGSIFDQLGLKNGDEIQRINGTQVDSLEKALPMLQMVKTESNVDIDMVRRGSKKTLDITIQ